MEIYIHRDNEDFGPYSPETAQDYINDGALLETDLAWHEGMDEWKPLGEVLGITRPALPAWASIIPPPSLPTERPPMQPTVPVWRPPAGARSVVRPVPPRKSGLTIAVNLSLILLIGAALYIRFAAGGETARRDIAAIWAIFAKPSEETPAVIATPAPQAPPPAPIMAVQAPTPPPVLAATPPPPKPFDPAELAGNPGAWPKTLRLKAPAVFPAVFNSQVVGSVSVPAGAVVNLLKIQGDQLIVVFQGGTQTLPWKATDLAEQVAMEEKAGPIAQPAPAAPQEATAQEAQRIASAPPPVNDEPDSDGALPGLGPQSRSYFGTLARH
jgi:hypothetical protein